MQIHDPVAILFTELKTFDGVGSFCKVSQSLKRTGMSDDFLLQLGVRESVAVDFLFANLDHLKWSSDPKPLIEYLRTATLTRQDMEKLRGTRYLPSENDPNQMFAPSELYLPDSALRIFPFVRLLQWPSNDDVTDRSLNGKFLVSLGMKVLPPLYQVLKYIADEAHDDILRRQCLDFVANKLGSGGSYQAEYSRLGKSDKTSLKFLPCIIKSPLSGEETRGCYSSLSCCSEMRVAVMGFPVLDLGSKTKLYGNLFHCADEPDAAALIQQLRLLVALSKKTLARASPEMKTPFSSKIISSFSSMFEYLSTRNMPSALIRDISDDTFIPCLVNGRLEWFAPNMVFFKNGNSEERSDLDAITESLFPSVAFSPFLSSAGVKQEASTKDIFQLMMQSPQTVFEAVKSEKRYIALLRRIAAHKPFRRVTSEIRSSAFLLAYSVSDGDDGKEKTTCELAKASDIYVIDNTFFCRMFAVKHAPHESDLEEFYALIGSSYISKVVEKRFDILGKPRTTSTTETLMERIQERGPLLVSPSVTSRPLNENASTVFDPKNFEIVQVPELKAVYSLGKSTRTNRTTCCSQQKMSRKQNTLVITPEFEMFDVGFAIGELILQRCQLEDAFFISSLLEAPLEQLRARGFPVDRIIKPAEVYIPEPAAVDMPAEKDQRRKIDPSHVEPVVNEDSSGAAEGNKESKSLLPIKESTEDPQKPQSQSASNAYLSMLKEMYPGADESYISEKLGSAPNLDRVKDVAEDLAVNGYPDDNAAMVESAREAGESKETVPSKMLGSKKLGRAFNGLKSSSFGGMTSRLKQSGAKSFSEEGMAAPPTNESNKEVQPKDDPILQENMERLLQHKVRSSPSVDGRGLESGEQNISIPEGLDHGTSCEVIPSQNIKPFVCQNGTFAAHNGIKVFSCSKVPSSEEYLRLHGDAVECFAVVLERLCNIVYGLPLQSVAICKFPTKGLPVRRGRAFREFV